MFDELFKEHIVTFLPSLSDSLKCKAVMGCVHSEYNPLKGSGAFWLADQTISTSPTAMCVSDKPQSKRLYQNIWHMNCEMNALSTISPRAGLKH